MNITNQGKSITMSGDLAVGGNTTTQSLNVTANASIVGDLTVTGKIINTSATPTTPPLQSEILLGDQSADKCWKISVDPTTNVLVFEQKINGNWILYQSLG